MVVYSVPPYPLVWIFLIVKHMKYLHLMARGKLLLKNPLNFSRKIPKIPQNSIKSHQITKFPKKSQIPCALRRKNLPLVFFLLLNFDALGNNFFISISGLILINECKKQHMKVMSDLICDCRMFLTKFVLLPHVIGALKY